MQVKLSHGLLRVSIKILFLEDDVLLAESVVDLLEDESFEVCHISNAQGVFEITFEQKFDLYLFDINIPLISGTTLLSELRQSGDTTPAVFLTSYTDKEMLKEGFLSGADDYITKPFDNDELILRIKAVAKRVGSLDMESVGLLSCDTLHKTIYYDSKEIELSKKEYELLTLLMKHKNNCVPKEVIMHELWVESEGGSDGALRVYINRIKQLIPEVNIQNIRGIGYKLVP